MQLPEVLYIHDSIWSGRKTGYTAGNGNYVKVNITVRIQRNHMSKFWCVKDSVLIKEMLLAGRVVQVWAGPHVLSFLENGVQVDELRLNPTGEAMQGNDKQILSRNPLKRELDSIGNL
jgi:hypothetical protein